MATTLKFRESLDIFPNKICNISITFLFFKKENIIFEILCIIIIIIRRKCTFSPYILAFYPFWSLHFNFTTFSP